MNLLESISYQLYESKADVAKKAGIAIASAAGIPLMAYGGYKLFGGDDVVTPTTTGGSSEKVGPSPQEKALGIVKNNLNNPLTQRETYNNLSLGARIAIAADGARDWTANLSPEEIRQFVDYIDKNPSYFTALTPQAQNLYRQYHMDYGTGDLKNVINI